jgi:tRNA pseudouridine55 synthase
MARRRPSTPGIDGVLLVDKPNGPTSHDIVAKLRRMAGQPRIGHGGTLDPFATGLLVLVLGRATRLVSLHLGGEKRYEATFSFGGSTTTDDLDGERMDLGGKAPSKSDVEALLPRFRGALAQVPPSHSAKRTDGVRAYERARAGEIVELEARPIEIKRFDLLGWDDSIPEEPLMQARLDVSSGTYIRAIARDLGRAVGSGAHLVSLRRVGSGVFAVGDAHTMEQIAAATLAGELGRLLLPIDAGLEHIPVSEVGEQGATLLRDGVPLPVGMLDHDGQQADEGGLLRLHVHGAIAALGRRTSFGAQPERVFIDANALVGHRS